MAGWKTCVRCGMRPRTFDIFLCWKCQNSPDTEREEREARLAVEATLDQRRWLVENMRWYGHWGRKV